MDNTLVDQRVAQFEQRHGDDGILVDGWVLFGDGASRDGNPVGVLKEPPTDRHERARRIIRYREIRLELASNEFWKQKNHYLKYAKVRLGEQVIDSVPEIETVAVRNLKKLKRRVKLWQSRLDEARELLDESKPENLRIRDETTEVYRKANESFLVAVEKIEI